MQNTNHCTNLTNRWCASRIINPGTNHGPSQVDIYHRHSPFHDIIRHDLSAACYQHDPTRNVPSIAKCIAINISSKTPLADLVWISILLHSFVWVYFRPVHPLWLGYFTCTTSRIRSSDELFLFCASARAKELHDASHTQTSPFQ